MCCFPFPKQLLPRFAGQGTDANASPRTRTSKIQRLDSDVYIDSLSELTDNVGDVDHQ
jgi:hypothetical protein